MQRDGFSNGMIENVKFAFIDLSQELLSRAKKKTFSARVSTMNVLKNTQKKSKSSVCRLAENLIGTCKSAT